MNYGKIAYMAYRDSSGGKSLVSGQPIPAWEELPLRIQESWKAAADAVEKAIQLPPTIEEAARRAFEDHVSGRQTQDHS